MANIKNQKGCSDCPFSLEDKNARRMSEEKLQALYKEHEHLFVTQNIVAREDKLWLVISHPCQSLKIVSAKCQSEFEVNSFITFLGNYLTNKKKLSVSDSRLISELLGFFTKIQEKFFKKR